MFILDTHTHKLIFRIDSDATKDYVNRWKEIKRDCENSNNKYIVEQMKTYCKLEQNKSIPYLEGEEGGIGGGNNILNKQIRFFTLFPTCIPLNYNKKDIVLDQITSTDSEQWTYEELDDLIYAFTKTFNYFINSDCITGVIEMSNNSNIESDNDNDNDSEENN